MMVSAMKTALIETTAPKSAASAEKPHRYQIYRQQHAGNYHPEFATDLASEAVEAFLQATPAFEGGALHLWDHHEGRSGAFVRWTAVGTDFGFRVSRRTNVFPDVTLAVAAREVLDREAMRETIRQSVRMSA
jgi:hypothetical protein